MYFLFVFALDTPANIHVVVSFDVPYDYVKTIRWKMKSKSVKSGFEFT